MAIVFGNGQGDGNVPIQAGLPRTVNIPSAIINSDLISDTAIASECFIDQRFSNKLQAYLIGYVNSIYSNYSVFK
jgi:hypothetical protein